MTCSFCHMLIHCLCKVCIRHALSVYCMPGTWLGTDHMTINKIHNKTKQYIKTRSFDKLSQYRLLNWRKQWHPTPVFLPGKSHGWRSLVGCSPWGREESDMTERLHFHFSLSCIGEGNGNPLQCSCLKNPRDGGAWWAAICWVT